MQEWEKKFDVVALNRGNALFRNEKVEDLKDVEGNISASVATIPRYEVSFVLNEGIPVRMKCQCPKYRSGRNCEHIAAVLYEVFFASQREEEKLAKSKAEEAKRKAAEKRARKAVEEAARKAAEEKEEKERAKKEVAERIAKRDA